MDGKVSLAWNQIYNQTANKNLEALLSKTKDINVVSPTWFSLVDRNGNLSTLADLDYVEKAHNKNIQVWALFNDFTDRNLTKKVLTSTKLRQRLVTNIMYYVDSYELDGVNIDFEYISKDIIDDYDLMTSGLSNNLIDFNHPIYAVKRYEDDNNEELKKNIKTKKIN